MLTDQRDLPFDSGRVDLRRPAVRVRAAHGVRPPLHVVRHALRVPRGRQDVARRGRRRGRRARLPLVEITGGEPLLQAGRLPVDARLLDAGKTVLIETGGHRSIADVPERVDHGSWTSSARAAASRRRTTGRTSIGSPRGIEVKFVIADRADYEYAREIIAARAAGRARAAPCCSRRSTACWTCADAVRVGARGSTAGARPAAAPQVHLGPGHGACEARQRQKAEADGESRIS